MELIEAVKSRRAVWDCADKPVPREHIRQVIEAA